MSVSTSARQPFRLVQGGASSQAPRAAFTPSAGADEQTTAYYRRIHEYAQQIRETGDVGEIVRLLDDALGETHALHNVAALTAARREVAAAESRITQLKREVEAMNDLLRVDHLTGALNRRGLEEAHTREASRADRCGAPLSVALIDLDNFKRLNDTAGHAAGDRVLQQVSEVLRTTLRPQDLVARYGGEEFAVVFPDTRLDAALHALERVKRRLAEISLAAPTQCAATFSAGVALRVTGEPLAALLTRADGALYAAKRAGKNRSLPAV